LRAHTATDAGGPVRAAGSIARAGAARPGVAALATARYVSRWMLRDTGWRVLAALGATNVAVHAWLDARGAASAAEVTRRTLSALMTHSRLFLILLATIYAGEMVWREREERSAEQFDAQPSGDAALLLGRVSGVIAAQSLLVLILAAAAMLAGIIAGQRLPVVPQYLLAVLQHLALPFVLWMLVSLAVHAVVQQKLVGHLVLIAAWVVGVLFADGTDFPMRLPGSALALAGVVSLTVAGLGWRRGDRRSVQSLR
jgi:ABC-2 type transport system permease protein